MLQAADDLFSWLDSDRKPNRGRLVPLTETCLNMQETGRHISQRTDVRDIGPKANMCLVAPHQAANDPTWNVTFPDRLLSPEHRLMVVAKAGHEDAMILHWGL